MPDVIAHNDVADLARVADLSVEQSRRSLSTQTCSIYNRVTVRNRLATLKDRREVAPYERADGSNFQDRGVLSVGTIADEAIGDPTTHR